MTYETMSEYLRRVGDDHAESGKDYTAQDYHQAADRIDCVEAEREAAIERAELAEKELENIISGT